MIILLTFDTKEECDKFIFLYNRYLKMVYYTIKHFVNDETTIEDLSQDVFIKLADHLDKIDLNNIQRTRNYIITITRNLCKNYLRHNKKIEEIPLDNIINENMNTESLLDLMIKKDFQKQLVKEIENLNEIYQIVLELKYFAHFSNDEIAQFLNLEKKTVEMRIYRANILLKEKLKEWKNE